MRDVIYNIMTFYEMRAKALSVSIANTQKVLREFGPDKERKAGEQAERLRDFVTNLTWEVNNMLTRFYFQKEHERMTDDQRMALVDFVDFVKTLTKNIQLLLRRFQKGQIFEEGIDKEIKELKTYVKQRLKEFDEALSETSDTLTNRLSKYVGHAFSNIRGCLRGNLSLRS